jgi:hypothetical protein
VLGGLVAELEDLGAGGVGAEEGVVEDGGEVLRGGEGVGGEGCCVELVGTVGKGIRDGKGAQELLLRRGEYTRRLLSIIPGCELVEWVPRRRFRWFSAD